jgi:lipoate-protein ligase B
MSSSGSERLIQACALGPIAYRASLELQERLVEARAAGRTSDWLLFPDHPPVLTVGRAPSEGNLKIPREELARRGIELFEVARGGDITWHGPGQLVGYTIVGLDIVDRDLHRFLHALEEILRTVLGTYEIESRTIAGRTGVWVGERKIASIGIAVRKWVSYHGFALNVCPDLGAFDVIHPCGLKDIQMTSMAALLGERAPAPEVVRAQVARALADHLGYPEPVWVPAGRLSGTASESDPSHGTHARPAHDPTEESRC